MHEGDTQLSSAVYSSSVQPLSEPYQVMPRVVTAVWREEMREENDTVQSEIRETIYKYWI